jgi:hypothetical protein
MAHDLTLIALAGLVAAVAGAGVAADTLPDPTRPPSFLFEAPGAAATAAEGAGSGYVLQSVLIGPGRRSAIISGRQMGVGDRMGDFTVVRIDDTEVLLRGAEGAHTLKLFPGVDKRAAQTAEGAPGNGLHPPRPPAQP